MIRTILALLALLTLSSPALAQDRVTVGVIERPPFAMQTSDGAWSGMAIDLWRFTAEDLGVAYEYVPVEDTGALERGEVDLVMPVYATPDLAARFDLSQPIYTATMGVASPTKGRVLSVLEGFASWQFARLVLGLAALLLVVGALVWLLERGRNSEQFARSPIRGLGDGFWWAGVTLTTIGYGDKAPQTLAGRAVAMFWMLVGLAVSAALTASVVALSGINRQIEAPEVFAESVVGVVEGSTTALYLGHEGVETRGYPDVASALAALDEDVVDMAAAAAPVLSHAIDEDGALSFTVRTTRLDPHYLALALPRDSALTAPLDVALLRSLTAESGWEVIERYVSP
ncbi:ion channel [Pseudoroseicyclus tamaricis]|uniref:Transporter substrate-binding domain-containing protein n=1 Tax=Pseudoroseicyclus tamaricis TaxID=2705421 RepID=A0A6B2JL94_9RHOB|nr:transporter substrate-binding domain-containing protein [Pseudoroseicyclus tamaricis]NDU99386.1 transporter substrate-binding domain-containing protein [Pseudoroseicyclus tamaricis]